MQTPIFLILLGSRSEAFAAAPLIEQIRQVENKLPFLLRVITTGQEDTELEQALMTLHIKPNARYYTKTSRLADARLDAALLETVESILRHYAPTAVLAARQGATAWAAATAAYFKHVPFLHLGAGDAWADKTQRPFPEWFHTPDITRMSSVHICNNSTCKNSIQQSPEGILPNATTCVTGNGADEVLARTLEQLTSAEPPLDPTLKIFQRDQAPVLAFLARREHHADALRPLCWALDAVSQAHAEHNFVMLHSLQSYICDALVSLVPRRENIHDISPLPYPAFVRELRRSRLVITDSARLAQEALLLRRPLLLIGAYADTESLRALAAETGQTYRVVPMEKETLENAINETLAAPTPDAAPERLEVAPAGKPTFDAILKWWRDIK
ncbi:TPA: hypothetical protein DDW35_00825 [Candidatus Sumerlaeota bacterium]|nr:hypothetical protein [Candidatus Sumerlaeota bacterium]